MERMKAFLFATFFYLISLSSFAFAQERQWSLDSNEQNIFLVFGVPDTDDVGLSFLCKAGQRDISILFQINAAAMKPRLHNQLRIKASGQDFTIPAKVTPSQTPDSFAIEGQMKLDDNIWKALSASSDVTFIINNQTAIYPLTDANFVGLKSFCLNKTN